MRYDLRFLKDQGRPKDGNLEGVVVAVPNLKIEVQRKRKRFVFKALLAR